MLWISFNQFISEATVHLAVLVLMEAWLLLRRIFISINATSFAISEWCVRLANVNTDQVLRFVRCGFHVWLADHITFGSGDRRIPLLREVYEEFPETPINIDIKVNDDELVRKVSWLFFLVYLLA